MLPEQAVGDLLRQAEFRSLAALSLLGEMRLSPALCRTSKLGCAEIELLGCYLSCELMRT